MESERFWKRVARADKASCWPWIGGRDLSGYGHFYDQGRILLAHRVSFELNVGSIPDGKWVLHKCDFPSCVNPSHLFIGDNKTNCMDRDSKRRQARGESIGTSKLKEQDIEQIRFLASAGGSSRTLARRFGVSHTTILKAVKFVHWRG